MKLISLFAIPVIFADQGIILNTANNRGKLPWNSITKNGWNQMTLNYKKVDQRQLTYQALAVCSIRNGEEDKEPEYWTFSDYIQVPTHVKFVNVELGSVQAVDCKSLKNRHCKEFVELYYQENGEQTLDKKKLTKMGKVGETIGNLDRDVFKVPVKNGGIQLALKDRGSCRGVGPIKIYYEYCPALAHDLSIFPDTYQTKGVQIEGKCVENTQSSSVYRTCESGKWTQQIGSCLCQAGFEPIENKCQACKIGWYKPSVGSEKCRQCPRNSENYEESSLDCVCRNGFYRTENEGPNVPCSGIPSAPTNLHLTSTHDSITLTWQQPLDIGGRFDTKYRLICTTLDNKPCNSTTQSNVLENFKYTYNNLQPSTSYKFTLLAFNAVSRFAFTDLADAEKSKSAVKTEATTKPIFNAEPFEISNTTVKLTWQLPFKTQQFKNFKIFENGKLLNISYKNEAILTNLIPGKPYEVKILPDPITAFDAFAAIASFQTSSYKPYEKPRPEKLTPEEFNPEFQVVVLAAVIIFCLIFILALICVCCKRKTKYEKNTSLRLAHSPATTTSGQTQPFIAKPSIHRTLQHVSNTNQPLLTSVSAFSVLDEKYGFSALTSQKRHNYIDPAFFSETVGKNKYKKFVRELKMEDIEDTDEFLGRGDFSTVTKGVLRNNFGHIPVAIKKLVKETDEDKKILLKEAALLGQLKHESIVKIEGVQFELEPCMIVTEFMEQGSLNRFVRANALTLTNNTLVRFLATIADGMNYLTSVVKFGHRDLAARNILVSYCKNSLQNSSDEGVIVSDADSNNSTLNRFEQNNLVVKISDFGLSSPLNISDPKSVKIPLRWTAPEVLSTKVPRQSSEIWSFGTLAWEVLSRGEYPYWNLSDEYIGKAFIAKKQEVLLDRPILCPGDLYERVIFPCFHPKPELRPNFEDIYSILSMPQMENQIPIKLHHSDDVSENNSIGQWLAFTCPGVRTEVFAKFLMAEVLTVKDLEPYFKSKYQLELIGITDPLVVNALLLSKRPSEKITKPVKDHFQIDRNNFYATQRRQNEISIPSRSFKQIVSNGKIVGTMQGVKNEWEGGRVEFPFQSVVEV